MNTASLAHKLAIAIAAAVAEPSGLDRNEGMIFIEGGSHREASDVADVIDEPGNLVEQARSVALDALLVVQHYISDQSDIPWPEGTADLPRPWADVTDDEIHLSYRDASGKMVLELPRIRW